VVVRRRVELVASAFADELSLRALAEITEITADQNVRVIGGQMASLLLAAFPVAGIGARRTRDADTAITTELAGSGVLHERLLEHGYAATSGNSYTRPVPALAVPDGPLPELAVDLLVPSFDGRFRPQEHGGRAFDAAPGLAPTWRPSQLSSTWALGCSMGRDWSSPRGCPPSNTRWSSRPCRMAHGWRLATSRTFTDSWRSRTRIRLTRSAAGKCRLPSWVVLVVTPPGISTRWLDRPDERALSAMPRYPQHTWPPSSQP
jgi:hypothetical protein